MAADQTVSPGDNVQEKVDAANAGETVTFKAGLHVAAFTVSDNNVTLKGEPNAYVVNPTDASGATVTFSGSGGKVQDLGILSTVGTALQFSGGGDAQVLRSTIATTSAGGTALATVAGPADTGRTLAVDSTVLYGKTALSASYSAPALLSSTTVNARHVTAIGNLTADKSLSPTSGLTFTVLDSIVRGTVGSGVTAATDRNSVAANSSDNGQLFVNFSKFNFHLRADAPVIDKGQLTSGESDKDIDGQARVNGSASDYGADEFVNRAPTAKLTAPTGPVRQGIAATFSADGSTDPEGAAGGGIATYQWDFGDGTTDTTTTPSASHAFPARQAYTVTLRVTDKQGATSDPVTVSVTTIDGTAPTVTIGQPGVKQRINLYKKKSKKRQRVVFFGTAADDTAMGAVALALRKVATKNGVCSWFDGKKSLKSASCTAPVILTAKLTNGQWRYTLPLGAKLPRGPYQLTAIAVDASGLAGPAQSVAFRFR
jgi:PKD repeat protein